ncbi:39S ribosomal protein L42, mitochondrial isoform X2 [Ceratitis capitata]|uniref:39S ribosomal protein L42, mitochondrial isoform X2 n=1 Tax=Ceratitis capitata TaxID=7213 RepID=UPI000A0FD948|nr:39S ribosomal protein L42, mitochondrial isoform X2 [Ceratitis capitata]
MLVNFIRKFSSIPGNVALKNALGVAWHPDLEFPYELTKPLPNAATIQNEALVKENSLRTAMSAFKNKKPEIARQEIMQLTHTTKHRWFPRSRDKRAKNTPMDRPYL